MSATPSTVGLPVAKYMKPRARRVSMEETVLVGKCLAPLPATRDKKYPWSHLTQEGSFFVIAGATRKRTLAVPKGAPYTVVQEVHLNPFTIGDTTYPAGLLVVCKDRPPGVTSESTTPTP